MHRDMVRTAVVCSGSGGGLEICGVAPPSANGALRMSSPATATAPIRLESRRLSIVTHDRVTSPAAPCICCALGVGCNDRAVGSNGHHYGSAKWRGR